MENLTTEQLKLLIILSDLIQKSQMTNNEKLEAQLILTKFSKDNEHKN